jgi:hypothetical protein
LEDLSFLARYLVMERQLVATGKPLISTEPRLAWRRGLEAALAENYDEVVLRNLRQILLAMAAVADERLHLFNAR